MRAGFAAVIITHGRPLYQALRFLASVGVLAQEGNRFALTPVGGGFSRVWGNLLLSAESGEQAFPHSFGKPSASRLFPDLREHPERARQAMLAGSHLSKVPVGDCLRFEVVDVGERLEHIQTLPLDFVVLEAVPI